MDSSVSPKDEIWFLRVGHHISDAIYMMHCNIMSSELELRHANALLLNESQQRSVAGVCLLQI